MTELDNNERIELLERQLAERVTQRVRPALFKLYAAVGAAVITVIGFVGWDVITDIKSEIKTEIKGEIEADLEDKRQEILSRATEIDYIAKRANKVIGEVEKQLDDFQPHAEDFQETVNNVKELSIKSKDLMALYVRFEPVIANIESFSRQLETLAKQVNELNKIASTISLNSDIKIDQTSKQRSDIIQSVISGTKEAKENFDKARKKPTVFFQFAGGTREQAEEISAKLKAAGYIVPGEDREGSAAREHEVRYFHVEDEQKAYELADDATDALRKLGYSESAIPDIKVEPLTSYAGKKPRVGVIELWVEIPPR